MHTVIRYWANEKDQSTEPHPQSKYSPDKGVDLEPNPDALQPDNPVLTEPHPGMVMPGGATKHGN